MAPPMNSYQRPTVINLRMSNHLAMDASVGVTLGVASGAKNRARSLMHRRTMPGDGQVDPDRCRCQGMRQGRPCFHFRTSLPAGRAPITPKT